MKPYELCSPEQVERRRAYLRQYRIDHPDRSRETVKRREKYQENRATLAPRRWAEIKAREEKDPAAREKRLAKKREHAKRCRLADPLVHKNKKREWRKAWRKTPVGRAKGVAELSKPKNKLKHALRHRLWLVLHGKKKMAPTLTYIGCSVEELRAHLESLFKPGMTWGNHDTLGWHIDHKLPLASFNFFAADGSLNEEELRRAMHYTNLQPLWYWENESKGARVA